MVNRYNLGVPGDSTAIVKADDGFLVQYTDYAALDIRHIDALTECERLEAELTLLKETLANIYSGTLVVKREPT